MALRIFSLFSNFIYLVTYIQNVCDVSRNVLNALGPSSSRLFPPWPTLCPPTTWGSMPADSTPPLVDLARDSPFLTVNRRGTSFLAPCCVDPPYQTVDPQPRELPSRHLLESNRFAQNRFELRYCCPGLGQGPRSRRLDSWLADSPFARWI